MRSLLIGLLATLWLGLPASVTAQDRSVAPLAIQASDPGQTVELPVIGIELPASVFTPYAETFYPDQWRVETQNHGPRQLYFAPDAEDDTRRLYGLWQPTRPTTLILHFAEDWVHFQPVFSVPLDPAQLQPGPAELLANWASARNAFFSRYVVDSQASSQLLAAWMRLAGQIYGSGDPGPLNRQSLPAEPVNVFSLLSGEAAIQETLQQQLLEAAPERQPAAETLADLSGPDVPAQPFAEKLGNRPGVELAIARLVPPDRFFVHSDSPAKTLGWLDEIAEVGFEFAGLQQRSYLRRELIERYLARLHLSRTLLDGLSPLAGQVALFGPDVYLGEGSHLTLLVEATASPLLDGLLKRVLGANPADADGIFAYGEAEPAYFTRFERWLIFSTSRTEAATALQLAKNGGTGSLGDSAEFRYMLEQLPLVQGNGLYVYFSDPFIRAMVGPQVKIAQLRRSQARARLHLVTAAALLYELDHGTAATLEELLRLGYVDRAWLGSSEGDRVELNNAVARSRLYGTLAAMTPLQELAIDSITVAERDAYQVYVDDYSRYWSEYFDPIGIRINMDEPLTVETLILPLIENSLYDAVRELIGGEPVALTVPAVTPEPVTMLSFKLPQGLARGIAAEQLHRDRIGFRLLQRLGNSVHIALYDNDPVVTLGSADVLGAFATPWLGGRDFLLWGLLGSLLTQPVALFVELDGRLDAVTLEDFVWDLVLDGDFGDSSFEQLGQDGRGWVYTLNVENLFRFHLYIRQIGNYLAISNRQIDFQPVDKTAEAPQANAWLHIAFNQIKALAPSLHLHQMQRRSSAEMKNIGRLLPFMLLKAETPAAAEERHAMIYGSRPAHPDGGEWLWQPLAQDLESSVFGSLWVPRLPSYFEDPAHPVGPLRDLNALDVRFRFEDAGVRVKLTLTDRTPRVQEVFPVNRAPR